MKKIKFLFVTHLGRIILGLAMMVIFGSLANDGFLGVYTENDIFSWLMVAGILLCSVEVVIMMAYAWIINPIRESKKNKEKP